MKKPFSALFARPPATPTFESYAAHATQMNNESVNRQRLVLITLRDLLHHSAIPAHWLECQTLLVSSRSRSASLYILLVIRHWDERFLRYTQAFQDELMARILRFDPEAGMWVHGIAWSFDAPGTCLFPVLPPKSTWDTDQKPLAARTIAAPSPETVGTTGTPAANLSAHAGSANVPASTHLGFAASAEPAEMSEMEQDLAALFAIRDRELNAAADSFKHPLPFDAAKPATLQ